MTDKPPGFSSRQAPMALLALCLVSYLPLIYRLGFYWDDWPSIWFYHLWGPNGYLQSFASDRPSLAWVFMLTTSLLGESTVGWQIFGLLTRWLASLTFRWLLLGVWPHYKPQVFAAAALVAASAANLYANEIQWPGKNGPSEYQRFLDIETGGSDS